MVKYEVSNLYHSKRFHAIRNENRVGVKNENDAGGAKYFVARSSTGDASPTTRPLYL